MFELALIRGDAHPKSRGTMATGVRRKKIAAERGEEPIELGRTAGLYASNEFLRLLSLITVWKLSAIWSYRSA